MQSFGPGHPIRLLHVTGEKPGPDGSWEAQTLQGFVTTCNPDIPKLDEAIILQAAAAAAVPDVIKPVMSAFGPNQHNLKNELHVRVEPMLLPPLELTDTNEPVHLPGPLYKGHFRLHLTLPASTRRGWTCVIRLRDLPPWIKTADGKREFRLKLSTKSTVTFNMPVLLYDGNGLGEALRGDWPPFQVELYKNPGHRRLGCVAVPLLSSWALDHRPEAVVERPADDDCLSRVDLRDLWLEQREQLGPGWRWADLPPAVMTQCGLPVATLLAGKTVHYRVYVRHAGEGTEKPAPCFPKPSTTKLSSLSSLASRNSSASSHSRLGTSRGAAGTAAQD